MPKIALTLCLTIALASVTSAIVKAQDAATSLRSLVADAAASQARRDFPAAAEAYRKATQLAPSIPELWANLGLMDHEIGKSSEAIASFQHAIRLGPSLFVPQLFLGIEFLAAKNPAAALPHLEIAEKLRPDDLQTALSLGTAFEMLDRTSRAVDSYARGTQIAPDDGNAWLDLGTAYLQQVENDARIMTSAYRHSGYVALRAAETLADEGSLNAAESWYKTAIAFPSQLPCAHAEYGMTLLRLKKVAEAETQFHLETQAHSHCALAPPGSATGSTARDQSRCDHAVNPGTLSSSADQERLLISCSFYAGDFETAAKAAGRLKSTPATRLEGLYWESKADEKLAVAALARAGEIEPDSPRMHVLIGDALRQKRHWSEAEAEYRKAIDLDPKSRAARLSLAIVLFTEMKTDQAFAVDKSLLEEIPDEPEANLLAAEILAQRHEFRQAEPFLARCQNLKIDLLPRYHVLLGQVYAANGRLPAAISQYKLGLASDRDGSIHYQLARLYEQIGDKANAEEEVRISREIRERWDRQAHIDLGQAQADARSE